MEITAAYDLGFTRCNGGLKISGKVGANVILGGPKIVLINEKDV